MPRAYEQIAVDALHSFISSNLQSALSAISATVPAPVAYVKAFSPADNRSPLIQIYDRGTEPLESGQRHAMAVVDCDLAITYNGRTDMEVNETVMRTYCEAIRDVLMDDPTLDGEVVQAEWTEVARDFAIDYDSQTRSARVFGISVVVHDPT